MNNKARGFSLIEVMIVVAIIGLLAGTLVPAYSNYVERSKIAEVLYMADAMRKGIAEAYMELGRMPSDINTMPVNMSASQSQYLSAINFSTTSTSATIICSLNDETMSASGDLALVGAITGNTFNWICNTPATTIENKYLPKNCHR